MLPTNNVSAARKLLRESQPASWETDKIVGHYLIAGGKNAIAAVDAMTAKTSLAADPGFKADAAQLGSGQLLSAYLPLHQLYESALPLLQKLPQYSRRSAALSAGAGQAPRGSSVAVGMSALRNQFRMDVIEHGIPQTKARRPVSPPTSARSRAARGWRSRWAAP